MKKPSKLAPEVVAMLLPRLKDEFTAYYFYRAAANYCKGVGFFKAAEFFQKESDSELEHAKKIENYLVDWNVNPELPSIEEPKTSYDGLSQIIELAYAIEYALYEEYEETSAKMFKVDLCTFDFIQEFRKIQTESVAEYSDMLNILEGVNTKDKFQLLLLQDKLF